MSASHSVSTASLTVKSSVLAAGNINDMSNSMFFSTMGGDGSVSGKVIYYSFAAVQPAYVYWDPSIGYGMPPLPSGLSSVVVTAIIVGVGLFFALTIGYLFRGKIANTSCVKSTPFLASCFGSTGYPH